MDLTTKVETQAGIISIDHHTRTLLLGSCFTTGIGCRMVDGGMDAVVNPWGALYNPQSIIQALTCPDAEFCQWSQHVPTVTPQAADFDLLILTLGTAWVYRLKQTGRVVANCKKQPDNLFQRQRLDTADIVADYAKYIEHTALPRGQKLLFTVSPIRHKRDGLHANQLSKATLLIAVDQLATMYPDVVSYFPAYEIMMDELRDYRFYADDMLHPSPLAVSYIWQRFVDTYCNTDTQQRITQFERLNRTLNHRPTDADSPEYQALINTTKAKIKELKDELRL